MWWRKLTRDKVDTNCKHDLQSSWVLVLQGQIKLICCCSTFWAQINLIWPYATYFTFSVRKSVVQYFLKSHQETSISKLLQSIHRQGSQRSPSAQCPSPSPSHHWWLNLDVIEINWRGNKTCPNHIHLLCLTSVWGETLTGRKTFGPLTLSYAVFQQCTYYLDDGSIPVVIIIVDPWFLDNRGGPSLRRVLSIIRMYLYMQQPW